MAILYKYTISIVIENNGDVEPCVVTPRVLAGTVGEREYRRAGGSTCSPRTRPRAPTATTLATSTPHNHFR